MVEFGYFASLEEFSPRECLDQVDLAADAGFDTVWVNDHFHPWFDHKQDGTEANGGNCWSWMPAALERTDDIRVGTGVTAMLNRFHPANLAHQLATMMELYPERVFFGVGTGEALNDAPLGFDFPDYGERARRTAEGIRIIRELFGGEFVDYDGTFWDLDGANLYTGPDEAPPIYVAGNGPTSARMAGDLGDGFVTVYEDQKSMDETLWPAVESGVGKSAHNESFDELHNSVHVHVSYDEDESKALEPCMPWRSTMLPVFFDANYADPRYLQAHGDKVGEKEVRDTIVVTDDIADVTAEVGRYVDMGFDEVVVQSHSPDQAEFCRLFEEEVMGSF
jgi:coenzyme F420-dependent glucose-6-phosphate dehydrogenase